MQRTELIRIVRKAAQKANMSAEPTAKLVKAVSDPKITMVARGGMVSESGRCVCPLVLAGLYDLETDTYHTDPERAGDFWSKFDDLSRELVIGRRDTILVEG